jgi:polar amino acid transport system substrate-binding protein
VKIIEGMGRRGRGPALLLALLLVGGLLLARPGRVAGQTEETLRVGVTHRPPLAIRYDEGWDGISVQLWQRAAGDLDLNYEWVELAAGEELEALQAGRVDLVITAVATAEAEAELDFSHSYFSSPAGFVQSGERQLLEVIRSIFSRGFLRTAGYLVVVLLVVGLLTWLFERRQNPEDFGGGILRGLWSGFWFAAVTLTAVGYGDKTPKTIMGRIVALVWMLIGLAVAATLTATIISVVALRTQATFSFPEDLRGRMVGTVSDSPGMAYLLAQEIDFEIYAEAEEGLRAVNAGELQFFVHEAATLRYYSDTLFDGRLAVVVTNTAPQRYALAMRDGDELRGPLNEAILRQINADIWPDILARFAAVEGP